MSFLAERVEKILPSPTLKIVAKSQELKASGADIISFGAGEPDFDTPTEIKEAAILALKKGKTKYTATAGTPDLRKAIIQKLKRDNHVEYDLDCVITSNGGKHSLFNLAMALINPNDEVLIPVPYWVSYPEQIRLCGGNPVFLMPSNESHFKITPQDLKSAITPKTKAIILNSPSNPTGTVYSKQELYELCQICVDNKIFIISDEIYEHIIYDNQVNTCIPALSSEIKKWCILVNGASKGYSMTGWRMGFAVGPKEIIQAMVKIQEQSTSNISSITQEAATQAFLGDLKTVHMMRDEFQKRRDYIVDALNAIPGFKCNKPEGAFYVFPSIKEILGKKDPEGQTIKTSEDFCLYLLNKYNVACVQGSGFGLEGYIRLSYATSMELIIKGVKRIHEAVLALK